MVRNRLYKSDAIVNISTVSDTAEIRELRPCTSHQQDYTREDSTEKIAVRKLWDA